MNISDILNSIDLSFTKNVQSCSSSGFDQFLDELKANISASEVLDKLDNLPKDTLFTLDRYEGNYAVCENRTTGEMYDIPRCKVSPSAKDGDILKFENGMFQIDYSKTEEQSEFSTSLFDKLSKFKDT